MGRFTGHRLISDHMRSQVVVNRLPELEKKVLRIRKNNC